MSSVLLIVYYVNYVFAGSTCDCE